MYIQLKTFFPLFLLSTLGVAHALPIASYDIGSSNWVAGMPNTYSSTVSGLTVTGTADKIITAGDPTAVYTGNDAQGVSRNFTYTFPAAPADALSCSVSLDFFHLSNNSVNEPESIGDFTPAPDNIALGVGHDFTSNTLLGSGSSSSIGANITTLSWDLPPTLSFNAPATGGNVSFVAHRNLTINCIFPAQAVPTFNQWGMILLACLLLIMGSVWFRRQHN